MNQILEKTLPAILQEFEVLYAVRPGQPKTGADKLSCIVFIAQAILMCSGEPVVGVLSVVDDVTFLINKMKDEGQLGGHGADDPVPRVALQTDVLDNSPETPIERFAERTYESDLQINRPLSDEGTEEQEQEPFRYKLPDSLKKPPAQI